MGPFKAIGASSSSYLSAPSPSFRGTEGEVSATPIDRVADCGFLIELFVGVGRARRVDADTTAP
jgi:hypothetical protein